MKGRCLKNHFTPDKDEHVGRLLQFGESRYRGGGNFLQLSTGSRDSESGLRGIVVLSIIAARQGFRGSLVERDSGRVIKRLI